MKKIPTYIKKLIVIFLIIILIPIMLDIGLSIFLCSKFQRGFFYKNNFIRKNFSIENYMETSDFREVSGADKKGMGITLFGCGFTYGYNELANYYAKTVSKVFKRIVYNRGMGGHYLQHSILQVQSGKIDDIIKNSQYAIFFNPSNSDYLRLNIYPGDIWDNNFLFSQYLYPKFIKDKNNELVLYTSKHPLIEGSVLYRIAEKIIGKYKYEHCPKYYENQEQRFVEHIIKLNNELKKINPKIQLIVVNYFHTENEAKQIANKLNEQGIITVTGHELLPDFEKRTKDNRKQNNSNDPRKEDWDAMIPNLKKYIVF